MGLDVHDMEALGENYIGYNDEVKRSDQFGLAFLRFALPYKPGHVFTIEPGCYFIPELIEKWKTEKKFTEFINYSRIDKYMSIGGIRIEDNVLITEKGHKLLGKPIPKTVKEIESICSLFSLCLLRVISFNSFCYTEKIRRTTELFRDITSKS
jgi:Xaa-Pro aminopeptidase